MIKRTLQEIADFFGCWVAVDCDSNFVYGYKSAPNLDLIGVINRWMGGELIGCVTGTEYVSDMPSNWTDTITAPTELPFKRGELAINKSNNSLESWFDDEYTNHKDYRRPTPEEWKKLKGESE